MACANFAPEVIEDHSAVLGHQDEKELWIKHYRPSELVPDPERPQHQLLKREPAVWAVVQISSGILSIGLGVVFAVVFNINELLLTLFRVPIISGVLFLFAGALTVMLYRNPGLLQMCFYSNILCLIVAAIGAFLTCVDLVLNKAKDLHHPVEILVLCVILLDMLVSGVLIFLISAAKRQHGKK